MTIQPDHALHGTVPQFNLADRLRKARETAGLDQAQFALEIGVSRKTVGNYESGKVEPRRIVIRAWALRTGVDLPWLEHGVNEKHAPSPDGEEARSTVRAKGFEPPTF